MNEINKYLQKTVTGDYPVGHETIAVSGEYPVYCNKYGAVSVKTEKGKLGLKPSEFDVIKFVLNPYISAEIAKRKYKKYLTWINVTGEGYKSGVTFPEYLDKEGE